RFRLEAQELDAPACKQVGLEQSELEPLERQWIVVVVLLERPVFDQPLVVLERKLVGGFLLVFGKRPKLGPALDHFAPQLNRLIEAPELFLGRGLKSKLRQCYLRRRSGLGNGRGRLVEPSRVEGDLRLQKRRESGIGLKPRF